MRLLTSIFSLLLISYNSFADTESEDTYIINQVTIPEYMATPEDLRLLRMFCNAPILRRCILSPMTPDAKGPFYKIVTAPAIKHKNLKSSPRYRGTPRIKGNIAHTLMEVST